MSSSIHFARQQVKSFLAAFCEARFAAARYQYATLATELGLSHRTLRCQIAIAFHAMPHKWLAAMRQRKAAELLRPTRPAAPPAAGRPAPGTGNPRCSLRGAGASPI